MPMAITQSNPHPKIFGDGADKSGMLRRYVSPLIKEFVSDYVTLAHGIIEHIPAPSRFIMARSAAASLVV